MTEKTTYLGDLLYRYLNEELSTEEMRDLDQWKNESPQNTELFEALTSPEEIRTGMEMYYASQEWKQAVDVKVQQHIHPAPRVHFLKTAWLRYAAILLLIAGTATYLYITSDPSSWKGPKVTKTATPLQPQDIPAGSNKAILTLADGSTIELENKDNGKTIEQLAGAANTTYNTITTPRGGQYQIVLPDGSKAWLNAASSIKFPATFNGAERTVDITGEVYMEIAQNRNQPFIVNTAGTEIHVLGTSFNINAYPDEPFTSTTLLEGSVQVTKGAQARLLKPGQQALVTPTEIKLIPTANTEKAIAWKNGVFNFEGSSMEEAMRQLARWYDIDIVYERGIPAVKFVGKMDKDISLPSLLKGLEEFGIHFRMEGRRLIVLP